MKIKKFEISWETADAIAVEALKAHQKIIKAELKRLSDNDDTDTNRLNMANARMDYGNIKAVLKYFGV